MRQTHNQQRGSRVGVSTALCEPLCSPAGDLARLTYRARMEESHSHRDEDSLWRLRIAEVGGAPAHYCARVAHRARVVAPGAHRAEGPPGRVRLTVVIGPPAGDLARLTQSARVVTSDAHRAEGPARRVCPAEVVGSPADQLSGPADGASVPGARAQRDVVGYSDERSLVLAGKRQDEHDREADDDRRLAHPGQRFHERREPPAALRTITPRAPGGECAAVWQVQLREHARDVCLDRLSAQAKARRDLCVRSALTYLLKHTLFAGRQHPGMSRAASFPAWHRATLAPAGREFHHPTTSHTGKSILAVPPSHRAYGHGQPQRRQWQPVLMSPPTSCSVHRSSSVRATEHTLMYSWVV